MTAHKHTALMAQYAQDWAETDEPWERWEVAAPGDKFVPLFNHPYWHEECEYRHKPRTLTYTVTVPEPMRETPEEDERYYFPSLSAKDFYSWNTWDGDDMDDRLYERGLCFATEEDAIAAAKAMLPIKQEEV